MNGHESGEYSSSAERSEQAVTESDERQEPPQRWGGQELSCLIRHEKLRLFALGLMLLALLAGFLIFLLSRSVLPLFAVLIVAYLGYRRLDAWLRTDETNT